MPKKLPRIGSQAVADQGVALVKLAVSRDRDQGGLGCLFRELPTGDMGIDGHIEIVQQEVGKPGEATGRLLSVQVKAGKSYFQHEEKDAWNVYVPKSTFQYWKAHSLPVLLVLANLEQGTCYWARADSDQHEELQSSFKVRVPKAAALAADAYFELARLAENTTEAGRRLARLQGDLELMQAVENGEVIAVDLGHWWNKSSGRTDVVVGYSSPGEYGKGPEGMISIADFTIFGGGGTSAVVEALFPWANARLDEDFLDSKRDDWYDEYLAATGTYDKEDGVYIDVLGTFDDSSYFDEEEPAPYADAAQEVGYYRFVVELNELGRAFLVLNDYLSDRTE